MDEKQIEEMADIIYSKINGANFDDVSDAVVALYDTGYRRQSEWISVDERLPEEVYGKHRKRISVLVCTKSGKISTASRQRAVHFDKSKLEWVELDTFDWSGRKHITHWMPLPEPPKMKGGAE